MTRESWLRWLLRQATKWLVMRLLTWFDWPLRQFGAVGDEVRGALEVLGLLLAGARRIQEQSLICEGEANEYYFQRGRAGSNFLEQAVYGYDARDSVERLDMHFRWFNWFDLSVSSSPVVMCIPKEHGVAGRMVGAFVSRPRKFKTLTISLGDLAFKFHRLRKTAESVSRAPRHRGDAIAVFHGARSPRTKKQMEMLSSFLVDASFCRNGGNVFSHLVEHFAELASETSEDVLVEEFDRGIEKALTTANGKFIGELIGEFRELNQVPSGRQVTGREVLGAILYAVWLECAYPHRDWKYSFYLPAFLGESTVLPYGLHVGFRAIPVLDAMLMLKYFVRAIFLPLILHGARERSERFALSAIMSRNMSHNIGSHVLAAAQTRGGSKARLVDENRDGRILFGYLQQRMDFIAQMSAELPGWTCPTWFLRDLMPRFYKQTLLLKYICESEKLTAYRYPALDVRGGEEPIHIRLRIGGRDEQGKWSYIDVSETDPNELSKKDFSLAIPGGIVGQHAFFVILEDIIRNAAKHGYSGAQRRGEAFEIMIDVDNDPAEDRVLFTIWDSYSSVEAESKADLPTGWTACLERCNRDRGTCPHPLYQWMNCHLVNPILGDDFRPRKGQWGLAEMRICAGYLQQRTNVEIMGKQEVDEKNNIAGKNGKPGAIRAVPADDPPRRLGFQFWVPRPRELTIIGMGKDVGDELKEDLRAHGVSIRDSKGPCDGEVCILCDGGGVNLVEKLKALGKCRAGGDDEVKAVREIAEMVEAFPYRLFVAVHKEVVKAVGDALTRNRFLDGRVAVIEESEVASFFEDLKKAAANSKELETAAVRFKEAFFSRWVASLSHRSRSGHTVARRIDFHFRPFEGSEAGGDDIVRQQVGHSTEGVCDEIASWMIESVPDNRKKDDVVRGAVKRAVDKALSPKEERSLATAIDDNLCVEEANGQVRMPDGDTRGKVDNILQKFCPSPNIETLPPAMREVLGSADKPWLEGVRGRIERLNSEISKTVADGFESWRVEYSRHGIVGEWLEKTKGRGYFEGLSGQAGHYSMLALDPGTEYLRNKLALQLAESGLIKILIIDERAGTFVRDNRATHERLDAACIFVVTEVLSDKGKSLWSVTEKAGDPKDGLAVGLRVSGLGSELQVKVQSGLGPGVAGRDDSRLQSIDFAIVHQGFLDKYFSNEDAGKLDEPSIAGDAKVRRKNFFIMGLRRVIPRVVVASGRGGEPANLPQNVKFLPYSSFESFVLEAKHEKLLLVQVLMNLLSRAL